MTLTRQMLDTIYSHWFRSRRNTEHAKQEILRLFAGEPDEYHEWMEQDICKQSRKIIDRWNDT